MEDRGLMGTQRLTAHVAAYHNNREPDGNPDEVVLVEIFAEADGTVITDPDRIAEVRAYQLAQGLEHPHERT